MNTEVDEEKDDFSDRDQSCLTGQNHALSSSEVPSCGGITAPMTTASVNPFCEIGVIDHAGAYNRIEQLEACAATAIEDPPNLYFLWPPEDVLSPW